MYNSDTDFLYPTRVTPLLRGIRGGVWDKLVDFISGTQSSEFEKAAFSLMMVRLGRCVDCDSDSFRASQGCTQCSKLMIHRFKGEDTDLENLYKSARKDLEKYQKSSETNR
jgi:hypothetical protein